MTRLQPNTAAVIRVAKGQAIAVVSEPAIALAKVVEVLDVEPGTYVVVPVRLWEQTVRKAMIDPAAAPATPELEVNAELPKARQQRRRARFDA